MESFVFLNERKSLNYQFSVPIGCSKKDIATQLIDRAELFTVILGGGLSYFLPESAGGIRTDDINLLNKWKSKMQRYRSRLVTNLTECRKVDLGNTDYLFGLFGNDHLDFEPFRTDQPSIEEMTEIAIQMLSKNKNGFFLMVEGGRIDHAHHQNKAKLAILETLAFEKAVIKGVVATDMKETLICVTGDHSHVFTLGSYAKRENDITKKNKARQGQESDGKGHTSLLYSNGPGYQNPRMDITDETIFTVDFVYNSGVPLEKETHGGEDVAIYSMGPWAHLFNGVHHQNYVGHVMMYASCTGLYKDEPHCAAVALKARAVFALCAILITSITRLLLTN